MTSQLETNLAALPEICYGIHTMDNSLVLIKRGESGYWPTYEDCAASTDEAANLLNDKRGVTRAQRRAMEMGSMFGFHVPGANPAAHETRIFIADLTTVDQRLADEAEAMHKTGATYAEIHERFTAIFETAKGARIADGVPV